MHIYFVSTTCSTKKYSEICAKRTVKTLDSSQLFFNMFLDGLNHRNDVKVDCISALPITASNYPSKKIVYETEKEQNVTFHYIAFRNKLFLKQIDSVRNIKKVLKNLVEKHHDDDAFLIVDPLFVEGSLASTSFAKKHHIKLTGFLTDLPRYAVFFDNKSAVKKMLYFFYEKKSERLLNKYDNFVFLTETMAQFVKNKNYIVVECFAKDYFDIDDRADKNDMSIVYAGKLHKEFGADLLKEMIPFVKHRCTFDIYGDGNYYKELDDLSKQDKRVVLHGISSLDQVHAAELNSDCLINPRQPNGEFTKYSFPSKTAEYLLSGNPVLMFRLEGIPEEYDTYLNFFRSSEPAQMAIDLDSLLDSKSAIIKAKKAREFMLKNKSVDAQTDQIITFIKK